MSTEPKLAGPFEILELEDGETLTTKILRWEIGEVTIHPAYQPGGKDIIGLRVHVPEDQKEFFPYYWDITGQTLVAQLVPYLRQPGFDTKTYTITKHGVAPRARFSLAVK